MKKKIVVLLMATAFSLSIFGCGKDTESVTSENVVETEEQEVEPDEETAEPDEKTAEPDENEDNAIDGLNEGTTINRDTGSSEETPDTTEDSATFIESGADGVDTQDTDALIAEYESESAIKVDPSTSEDGVWDAYGNNLETGKYDPYHDTNGGKGIDRGGVHYDTIGEANDGLSNTPGMLTPEQLEQEEKLEEMMKEHPNGVVVERDEAGNIISMRPAGE